MKKVLFISLRMFTGILVSVCMSTVDVYLQYSYISFHDRGSMYLVGISSCETGHPIRHDGKLI